MLKENTSVQEKYAKQLIDALNARAQFEKQAKRYVFSSAEEYLLDAIQSGEIFTGWEDKLDINLEHSCAEVLADAMGVLRDNYGARIAEDLENNRKALTALILLLLSDDFDNNEVRYVTEFVIPRLWADIMDEDKGILGNTINFRDFKSEFIYLDCYCRCALLDQARLALCLLNKDKRKDLVRAFENSVAAYAESEDDKFRYAIAYDKHLLED